MKHELDKSLQRGGGRKICRYIPVVKFTKGLTACALNLCVRITELMCRGVGSKREAKVSPSVIITWVPTHTGWNEMYLNLRQIFKGAVCNSIPIRLFVQISELLLKVL